MSKAPKSFKTGTKGEQILAAFETAGAKGRTRKDVAEEVGCTVARVAEKIRDERARFTNKGTLWILKPAKPARAAKPRPAAEASETDGLKPRRRTRKAAK